jgi:hypothetical protein
MSKISAAVIWTVFQFHYPFHRCFSPPLVDPSFSISMDEQGEVVLSEGFCADYLSRLTKRHERDEEGVMIVLVEKVACGCGKVVFGVKCRGGIVLAEL